MGIALNLGPETDRIYWIDRIGVKERRFQSAAPLGFGNPVLLLSEGLERWG